MTQQPGMKATDSLVDRLRAARESRHGKGPLKVPSVPCLYEEAADALEAAERDKQAWMDAYTTCLTRDFEPMRARAEAAEARILEVERDHLSGIKWAEAEMDRLDRLVAAASVLAARLVLGIPPRSDTARVLPEHSDPAAWWDDVENKLDTFLALERQQNRDSAQPDMSLGHWDADGRTFRIKHPFSECGVCSAARTLQEPEIGKPRSSGPPYNDEGVPM
jgi:hypothetical protein